MRIEETITIDAPARGDLGDRHRPRAVPRTSPTSITRWEPEGEKRPRPGRALLDADARRLGRGRRARRGRRVGRGRATWPGRSVKGIDQRGRWRLREQDDGTTKVTLRLAYQAPGGLLGMISDQVSAVPVRGNLRGTLENLKAMIEGEEHELESGGGFNPIGVRRPGGRDRARGASRRAWRGRRGPDRMARALHVVRTRSGSDARPPATRRTRSSARTRPRSSTSSARSPSARCTSARTRSRTRWLDAGLGEGDGVAIMCRNHRGFIEATVAASKLGAHAPLPEHGVRRSAAHRGRPAREARRRSSTTRSSPSCSRTPASAASASSPGSTTTRPPDPTLEELIESRRHRVARCRRPSPAAS